MAILVCRECKGQGSRAEDLLDFFFDPPPRVPVANKGLVWDSRT